MDIFLIIGIIIGFLAIIAGMLAKGADISVLLNSEAFMIICIGTIASVMNSFPKKEFFNIPRLLGVLFRGKQKDDSVSLIKQIVELAKETRKNGLLSLEGTTQNMDNSFLKTGIEMVVDGVEPEYVICIPFSLRLKRKSSEEVNNIQIILEGILCIQEGKNPKAIEQKLKTMLRPKDRKGLE